MSWNWWSELKPEAQAAWVQAVGSIVAIFAAIIVAWWQAHQNRKQQRAQWEHEEAHRRIAIRPYLSIEEITQREAPLMSLVLRNTGVGPAIIEHFELQIDGSVVYYGAAYFWQHVFERLNLPARTNSGGTVLADGQSIMAGQERTLMRYQPAVADEASTKLLLEAFARVEIKIKYRSLYGEEFNLGSDDADEAISFCLE